MANDFRILDLGSRGNSGVSRTVFSFVAKLFPASTVKKKQQESGVS
jgi:hypothetical protein